MREYSFRRLATMSSKKFPVLHLLVCALGLTSSVCSKEEAKQERDMIASSDQCPWFFYSPTLKCLQGVGQPESVTVCTMGHGGALLGFGQLTYDEESGGIFVGPSLSFMVSGRNV